MLKPKPAVPLSSSPSLLCTSPLPTFSFLLPPSYCPADHVISVFLVPRRPTCLGACSQRSLTLRNPSRVPVAFRWQLPARLDGIMTVSPETGVLRGNEAAQVVWSFAPGKQKTYDLRVPCLLYDPSDEAAAAAAAAALHSTVVAAAPEVAFPKGSASQQSPAAGTTTEEGDSVDPDAEEGATEAAAPTGLPAPATAPLLPPGVDRVLLHVLGEGTAGALVLDPPTLDLGTLRVGHAVTRTVTLLNRSDGVLRYRVDCGPEAEADGPREPGSMPVEFPQTGLSAAVGEALRAGEEIWVDEPEGAIPARASKVITVTFFPRFRKLYRLQMCCRTSTIAPLMTSSTAAGSPLPMTRPPSGGTLQRPAVLPPLLLKQRSARGGGDALVATLVGTQQAVLGAAASPSAAAEAKWPSAPAVCSVVATTVFPRLMVTDVLLEGIPKQVGEHMLWVAGVRAWGGARQGPGSGKGVGRSPGQRGKGSQQVLGPSQSSCCLILAVLN